jgi:hypothetical protein
MGRTFDNALLNLGLKDQYRDGVQELGFRLEDVLLQERDAGLGNVRINVPIIHQVSFIDLREDLVVSLPVIWTLRLPKSSHCGVTACDTSMASSNS